MRIDIMTQEGIKEVINKMLLNIYFGSDVQTEVAFAVNCIEGILGIDFNEDQEVAVNYELLKIIKNKKNLSEKLNKR